MAYDEGEARALVVDQRLVSDMRPDSSVQLSLLTLVGQYSVKL